MALDHTTYLERHHELTNNALTDVALFLGRGDIENAVALLTSTRQQIDALWSDRTEGLRPTAEDLPWAERDMTPAVEFVDGALVRRLNADEPAELVAEQPARLVR